MYGYSQELNFDNGDVVASSLSISELYTSLLSTQLLVLVDCPSLPQLLEDSTSPLSVSPPDTSLASYIF